METHLILFSLTAQVPRRPLPHLGGGQADRDPPEGLAGPRARRIQERQDIATERAPLAREQRLREPHDAQEEDHAEHRGAQLQTAPGEVQVCPEAHQHRGEPGGGGRGLRRTAQVGVCGVLCECVFFVIRWGEVL